MGKDKDSSRGGSPQAPRSTHGVRYWDLTKGSDEKHGKQQTRRDYDGDDEMFSFSVGWSLFSFFAFVFVVLRFRFSGLVRLQSSNFHIDHNLSTFPNIV